MKLVENTTVGYQNLGLAIIHKAQLDARSRDAHIRLEALGWLLADAPKLLDEMNVDYSTDKFYDRVLKGEVGHVRFP